MSTVETPSNPLAETVSYQLAVIAGAVQQRAKVMIQDRGLTPREFEVLVVLWQLGPMDQSRLAAALSIRPNTLVPFIDDLEQRRLVTRCRDEHDRRKQNIQLLPQAVTFLERTAAAARAER